MIYLLFFRLDNDSIFDGDNYLTSRGIMSSNGLHSSSSPKKMPNLGYNPPSKMIKGVKGKSKIFE